jgi:recombination protein RecT
MTKEVIKSEVSTVREVLEKMKSQFEMVLPKHLTPDRLCRIAITAVQQTPKLLECDRTSLYSAIMRAAQLGLEPDGILGQAYLIPYAGKVQLIVGYKGLIDLSRRSGDVSSIITKEVYENDDFRIAWHEAMPFSHTQDPGLADRGNVIGYWALARFKDGSFHWDYMTKQEVLKIRDCSSGWKQAVKYNKTAEHPWILHETEMGKKTVLRRIAKYLPMSVQRAVETENLVDANKNFTVNELGEIQLDSSPLQEVQEVNANPLDTLAAKLEEAAPVKKSEEQISLKKEAAMAEIITPKPEVVKEEKTEVSLFLVSPDGEALTLGEGGLKIAELLAKLKEWDNTQKENFIIYNEVILDKLCDFLIANGSQKFAESIKKMNQTMIKNGGKL